MIMTDWSDSRISALLYPLPPMEPRPFLRASVSDVGEQRRCSVTFSVVPAAKAAAKSHPPRLVRVLWIPASHAARAAVVISHFPFDARLSRVRGHPDDTAPDANLTVSPDFASDAGKCPWSDCSCGVGCKCGAACKCGSKRR
jgi:hypothetical protein